jgi:hypothetical protein
MTHDDNPFSADPKLRARGIRRAFADLERAGLIRKDGRIRKGKPVYVVTERANAGLGDPASERSRTCSG